MVTVFVLSMLVPQDWSEVLVPKEDPVELGDWERLDNPLRQEEDADVLPLTDIGENESWFLKGYPREPVFRNYLADPLTPRFGLKFMIPIHGPDNVKIENALGAQGTLARWTSPAGDEAIDVSMEGAVFARFDVSENWDMDAADFRVGFPIGYRRGKFSAKLHIWQ